MQRGRERREIVGVWGSAPDKKALCDLCSSAPLRENIPHHQLQPRMKPLATAFALLLTLSSSALPLTWRADWPDCKPVETLVHRGTDVELRPVWYINGAAAATNGWTFATYVQTNAVGQWFGPLPGAAFSHTNDVGAAFYSVMVRAQGADGGVNYTAFARFRMLDSPGFTPGELPLPAKVIDFADVTVLNAPWPDASITNGFVTAAAATNIAEAVAASATNALDVSLSSRLSRESQNSTNYTDTAIAAATNDLASASSLTNYATRAEMFPVLLTEYYPEGNVKSAAEFTAGIKYDAPDTVNRTITVKPFCNTGDSDNDNSGLVGRVVIPPFVDTQGNPYISDDGTRFRVVGVAAGDSNGSQDWLTAIVAPNTATTIERGAFERCDSLASVSLPAATTIASSAFDYCSALTSVSLPAATSIGNYAFYSCTSLASVDFGDTPRLSVPSLGFGAFHAVPSTCKIIIPDLQYDEWIAASEWSDLYAAGYKFLRHSEWEYARKYELPAASVLADIAETATNALETADAAAAASSTNSANIATLNAQVASIGADLNAMPQLATNAAEFAVATADTSYRRVYSLTNLNQTVQYVELDETQTSLSIELPTTGDTKDWLVYIYAATNATLSLPSGVTWWTSDAANTNAIEAATPTALYFSQISTNIFMLGRQKLESVGGAL